MKSNKHVHEGIEVSGLQVKQDELSAAYELAMVIRTPGGDMITAISYPPSCKTDMSDAARRGLEYCLLTDLSLARGDLEQGRTIFATAFSGSITTAAVPLLAEEMLGGILQLAQPGGDVGEQLEELSHAATRSKCQYPITDFLDELPIEIDPLFISAARKMGGELGIFFRAPAAETAAAEATVQPYRESARSHLFWEHLPGAAFFVSRNWGIEEVNAQFLTMLGYARPDVERLNFLADVCEIEALHLIEELQGRGYLHDRDIEVRRADGTHLPVKMTVVLEEDDDGELVGYRGILTEASHHPQEAVDIIKADSSQTSPLLSFTGAIDNIIHAVRDAIIIIDHTTEIIRINASACALLKTSEGDLLGHSVREQIAKDVRQELTTYIKETLKVGKLEDKPLRLRAGEADVEVVVSFFLLPATEDTAVRIMMVARAVGKELTETQTRCLYLLEKTRDLYWAIEITDPEHFELAIPLDVGRGFTDVDDLETLKREGGMLRAKITHTKESWENFRKSCLAVYTSQQLLSNVKTAHVDRNGNIEQTFISDIFPLYDKEGRLIGIQGLSRDTSEEYRSQQELKHSEEKFRSLVEDIHDGVAIIDNEGKFEYVNKRVMELFGHAGDKIEKMELSDLIQPADRERFQHFYRRQAFEGEARKSEDFRAITGRNEEILVDVNITPRLCNGKVIGACAVLRDLTERRKLEEQLFQAQKMESIGTLAGGISHDFNNILTEIMGYASLLESEEDMPLRHKGMIAQIREYATMAANLTQQLLTFSRNAQSPKKPMQLNEVIKDTARFLSHSMPDTVALKTHLASGLDAISGDPVQLQQVLMNLCVNARDSMPEGGKIVIRTENLTLTPELKVLLPNFTSHHLVRLRITDTGSGINPDILDRIFEPFFTTKGQGKGTGLGLSIVYGIVKSHGGEIKVRSEVGEGTTFDIYLPAIPQQSLPRVEAKMRIHSGGGETILLIDDEEEILELSRRMLHKFGYHVLTATSGGEGIELYQKHAGAIALVIIDLIMAEMDGKGCAANLRHLDPDVKILISSGYMPTSEGREEFKDLVNGFLQKPYTLQKLIEVVRYTIGSGEKNLR